MRRYIASTFVSFVALFAGPPVATPQDAPPKPVSILEDDLTKILECKGGEVSVLGNRNTLRLDGECPLVVVSGSDNTVAIQVASVIKATGDRNRVTWAVANEKKGKEPTVQNTGTQNQIAKIQQ